MSLKIIITPLIAAQLALLPTAAQAQSSDFNHPFARQGSEARMSFTIPLGHSSDKTKTAPRLNLGVRHYTQPSPSSLDWMLADPHAFKDVRIGLTLEDTPKLMMNGQVLALSEEEQANIGTAGKIGLGVAAVALVGAAVIAVFIISCESGPGDEQCSQ